MKCTIEDCTIDHADRGFYGNHYRVVDPLAAAQRKRWQAMIRRCTNPSDPSYSNYGGRGIRVCDRWRESYEAFHGDVGYPPTSEHSIDRVDNDGDYEPGNVRWATRTTQQINRRRFRNNKSGHVG